MPVNQVRILLAERNLLPKNRIAAPVAAEISEPQVPMIAAPVAEDVLRRTA
jgi:hypothetical protein